jgi:superfamily II DNA or RNA helicase
MNLWDYQIEARDAVLNSQIGQVISPTGTGKSVIQSSVFEELIKGSMVNGKSVFGIYVILTPRIGKS